MIAFKSVRLNLDSLSRSLSCLRDRHILSESIALLSYLVFGVPRADLLLSTPISK